MTLLLNNQFDGPRRKVARVEKHLDELKSEIHDFLKLRPILLRVRRSWKRAGEQREMHEFVVEKTTEVPQTISPILGDCIHNLRSALGILVCDLVRLKNNSTDGVAFPFARTADDLNGEVRNRKLNQADDKYVEYVKSLRPYYGGNSMVRELHDLDIHDKHNTLLPTLCAVTTLPMMIEGPPKPLSPPVPGLTMFAVDHPEMINPVATTHGQVVCRFPRAREFNVGDVGPSIPLISFSSKYFDKTSVIDAVGQLISMSKRIVDEVERL